MGRIINVNKEIEKLSIEEFREHETGYIFKIVSFGSSMYELYYIDEEEKECPSYEIQVEVKKKLFKGYILILHYSYNTTNRERVNKSIVLNPHEPIKLKSDMIEYTEWVGDVLTSAFKGEV